MNVNEAQAALEAVRDRREQTIIQVRDLEKAVARAREIVGEYEQELGVHTEAEAQIGASHADQLKAFASHGGTRPSFETTETHRDLVVARETAKTLLGAATQAFDGLAGELATALADLAGLDEAVRAAAVNVLRAEAEVDAGELAKREFEAAALRGKLKALARLGFGLPLNGSRGGLLGPKAREILGAKPVNADDLQGRVMNREMELAHHVLKARLASLQMTAADLAL